MSKWILLCFVLVGCSSVPGAREAELAGYCDRWAGKFVAAGHHADPEGYRAELVTSCLALKGVAPRARREGVSPAPTAMVAPDVRGQTPEDQAYKQARYRCVQDS